MEEGYFHVKEGHRLIGNGLRKVERHLGGLKQVMYSSEGKREGDQVFLGF